MRATCDGRVRRTLCRPPLINDAQHWRKRADEARSLADDMKDEISKQMMLQIARLRASRKPCRTSGTRRPPNWLKAV